MPSLLSSYVAANYGKMVPQQTYGIGEPFTNFGTRQLQLIKVAVGGTAVDLTKADGTNASPDYSGTNSLYSVAIRSLQQFSEVYAVFAPAAGQFAAIVAIDTGNSADAGEAKNPAPGAINTGYGQAEAAIAKALDAAKVNSTKNSSCTITQLGASDLNGL